MRSLLTVLLFLIPAALDAATTSTIAACAHTASSSQTVVLTGDFLWDDVLYVGDGTTTAACTTRWQTNRLMIATLPDGLSTGTYWLWMEDGANSVTINHPEPWWIYPNDPVVGATVRLFGRNLNNINMAVGDSYTGLVKDSDSNTTSVEITVVSPIEATFIVPSTWAGNECPVYLPEWKNGITEAYTDAACTFTVEAAWTRPAGSVTLTDYGAVADDDTSDDLALQTALAALDGSSSAILHVPAGQFDFDCTPDIADASGEMFHVDTNIEIRGASSATTILNFDPPTTPTRLGTPLASLRVLKMYTRSKITNCTIRIAGYWYREGSTDIIWPVGSDVEVTDVLYNADNTSESQMVPIGVYSGGVTGLVIDDMEIYGAKYIRVDKTRQIRINNVRHYGAKRMDQYYSIGDAYAFSSTIIQAAGWWRHALVENCRAEARWSMRGHLQRFCVIANNNGPSRDVVIQNNVTRYVSATPFANTGENIMFH